VAFESAALLDFGAGFALLGFYLGVDRYFSLRILGVFLVWLHTNQLTRCSVPVCTEPAKALFRCKSTLLAAFFRYFIGLIPLQPTYRELLYLCAMNPRAERPVLLHYSHRYFTESFIFALFKALSRALYGEKCLLFVQGFGVIEPALGIAQQTGMPALLAMIYIFGQI